MEKSELIGQKYPLRIDKNITKNILSFNDYIEDNPLIFTVMIHIAKTYQRNFWNFGTFKPKEFAKEWNYSTNYLRSLAPEPYHYKVLTKGLNHDEALQHIERLKALEKENPNDASYRIWDSILEDALYRLANLNIQLRNGGTAHTVMEGQLNYDSISSERILKNVTALYKKSKSGSPTIIYDYEVDNEFLINLSKLYVKADKTVIHQLKSSKAKNLDTFYIFLLNLRDDMEAKKSNVATPYFHVLCKLLGLESIKEPRKRKSKITLKINTIKKYSPDLIENFEWVKENKNSKYSYQPKITFTSKFSSLSIKKEYNSFEKQQKFNVVLSNELKNTYDKITPREQRNKYNFLEFLQNPNMAKERRLALANCILITSGSADISDKDLKMFNDFIDLMVNGKNIYEVSKIFK